MVEKSQSELHTTSHEKEGHERLFFQVNSSEGPMDLDAHQETVHIPAPLPYSVAVVVLLNFSSDSNYADIEPQLTSSEHR